MEVELHHICRNQEVVRRPQTLQGHARQVWGQATELIGTGQQQQYALAAKQADEAQKAATPKEVEGPKAAHTAIQRAERNYEVEEIFDRWTENNVAGYRVKWTGYSARHNSREPESALAGAVAAIAKFEKKIKRPKQKT